MLIYLGETFLIAFAELLKATISFVISVCLSACLSSRPSVRLSFHGTTGLPLDGFSQNLTVECFSKICRVCYSFINN